MHVTLRSHLHQTRESLQALPVPLYQRANQDALRRLLAATRYAFGVLLTEPPPVSGSDLLRRHLNLLDEQAQALTGPGKVALGTWHQLHSCLRVALEAVLPAKPDSNLGEDAAGPDRSDDHP